MDASYREALALEQDFAGRSPEQLKFYGAWAKSRDDMRAWFRVAELSFNICLAQATRR